MYVIEFFKVAFSSIRSTNSVEAPQWLKFLNHTRVICYFLHALGSFYERISDPLILIYLFTERVKNGGAYNTIHLHRTVYLTLSVCVCAN